ncbi:MAG: DUF1003 domain-containing protein [Deltaproteobacteria bacterium]|nr:DUF1003 domain-containing protein [Deltaproteobacteria bacterium]
MEDKVEKLQSCFHCGQSLPFDMLISGELIRPGVAELIRKRDPAWAPSSMLCPDCLNAFRSEYVEDALEEEKGELSRLDMEVISSLKEQETLAENLNLAFERDLTPGQYVADRVAAFGGSWTFIIMFFAVLVAWMAVNSHAVLVHAFDPYPYILLNLVLSCLAAMQAPIIMMSQNRLEARDRLRSEHDYQINLKAELEVRHLHEKLDVLLKHQWQKLLEIQQIQLDLMKELAPRNLRGNR